MTNEWIEFNDDHRNSDRLNPRVSLDGRRHFRLNAKALELLGRPEAVRFLFDARRNRIGVRPEDLDKAHAFQVVPNKSGTTSIVRGYPFCKRFGIKPDFTIAFQSVHLDGSGTLILDLSTAKRKAN